MRVSRVLPKVRRQLRLSSTDTKALAVAMAILRMIKLFGWEPKIAERLAEKREQELQYVKTRQILNLINGNIKWVLFAIRVVFSLILLFSYFIPVITVRPRIWPTAFL
jgi:uncharacterized membrane protein